MKNGLYEFICELLLLVTFVLCGSYLILIGSNVLTYSNECNEGIYTAVKSMYINNKVRENDRADLIEVEDNSLKFRFEESNYINYIYMLDNDLCELLTDPNDGVKLDLGYHVLNDIDLACNKEDNKIYYSLDGKKHVTALRSGRDYNVR